MNSASIIILFNDPPPCSSSSSSSVHNSLRAVSQRALLSSAADSR